MKAMKLVSLLCLGVAVSLAGCAAVPVPTPDPDPAVDQFEVVRKALDDYLSSDPPAAIGAAAVQEGITEGDDQFILSVRAPEAYALGHIPGAINIPWRTVGNEGAVDALPTDEPIVVYCYTGHTGAVATACLNAMGYDATNMKWGMCGWTSDETVRASSPFNEATDANDFPVSTTPFTVEADQELPELNVTDSEDEAEIIRAAAEAYLTGDNSPIITAAALSEALGDGEDLFIISVRGADDYAAGHIEGAINIPWKQIAKPENLQMIPPDADIVVYCYTGHSGGLATTVLNMLGYNARNMKFGMVAWTEDPDVRVAAPFSEETSVGNYEFEVGE